MSSRRESRETLFKLVYQMGATGDFSSKAKDDFLEEHLSFEGHHEPDMTYFNHVYDILIDNLGEIDSRISDHLKKGWSIKRIKRVDLAILRLATAEMIYSRKPYLVPYKVAINEAVEVSKKFGDDMSRYFINGILGRIWDDSNG